MATDVEVLVAGAGAAGLAAGLAAGSRQRSVAVLEASETFRDGSNTAMSTSMIPAGGTRFQAAAGVEDSPELFRADIERKTVGTADPVVAQALTEVAPELVHWLVDAWELPLGLVTDMNYPGHTTYRCHSVPDRAGRSLHAHLLRALGELPNVDLVVPMRLTDLREDAGVLVAILTTPDGGTEVLRARSVVLATNGYGAAPDLVRAHAPEIAGALYHGGDSSRGDALTIGRDLGADTGYLDAYQGHGSVAVPHGILLTWATVMHGAVLVDADGQRFGDETIGYSEFGSRVVARPGGLSWMVYDRRIHDACLAFRDYQDIVDAGAVGWFDTPADLAASIGCPTNALETTLATADRAATGGPDPHGRTLWEGPLVAPLAAVKVTGALFHTQGGLRVDEHARVLRDGQAIPGLYAAGGAAVGISGHGASGYLAGNGLLGALGLGYLAGSHAASRIDDGADL